MNEGNQEEDFLGVLKIRFENNMHRHENIHWNDVEDRLQIHPSKIEILVKMEKTGGEPDVVGFDNMLNEIIFCDCSKETPIGRRSLCYDDKALKERKDNKPKSTVLSMAEEIGVKLLNEEEYRQLQKLEAFDTKTSSWIETPKKIRDLGGALFADFRYNHVFVYHNGASSYYAARGFRGILKV